MHALLLTLHATGAAITVGVLFAESLAVVMALRLLGEAQRHAVRLVLGRLQAYAYYPMLALTLITGGWIAVSDDLLRSAGWLHWKLVAVVLLIGLGLLTGQAIRAERPARPLVLATHIGVLGVSLAILALAVLRPF